MELYILDENGEPMKLDGDLMDVVFKYGMWTQNNEVHIFDDTIDGIRVSTVFLGVDHNFGRGPAVLFETMVFGGDYNHYCCRYCNRLQAKAGHDQALSMVREGLYGLSEPDLESLEYGDKDEEG